MSVEWFEYVAREKTVVYARVLVLLEFWKLILSNIYHDCVVCADTASAGVYGIVVILLSLGSERVMDRKLSKALRAMTSAPLLPKTWNENSEYPSQLA